MSGIEPNPFHTLPWPYLPQFLLVPPYRKLPISPLASVSEWNWTCPLSFLLSLALPAAISIGTAVQEAPNFSSCFNKWLDLMTWSSVEPRSQTTPSGVPRHATTSWRSSRKWWCHAVTHNAICCEQMEWVINHFLIITNIQLKEKQGRIHFSPVPEAWEDRNSQKMLTLKRIYQRTNRLDRTSHTTGSRITHR